MAICSSGAFSGDPGSTSIDQSIRVWAFHCLSLPFSYRLSRRSRPSSYSRLKMVVEPEGTSHCVCSTGRAKNRVLTTQLYAPVGGDGTRDTPQRRLRD